MNFTAEECESLLALCRYARDKIESKLAHDDPEDSERRWLMKRHDQSMELIAKLEAPIARR